MVKNKTTKKHIKFNNITEVGGSNNIASTPPSTNISTSPAPPGFPSPPPPPAVDANKSGGSKGGILDFLHESIMAMNNSKFFAGIIIISLNIASKYVSIKLSKTTEAYLKYTFSRQLLIFAMAWMATRDIYSSLIITAVFVVLADYLFNDESNFCCFSDNFKKKCLDMETSWKDNNKTGTRPLSSLNGPSEEDVKRSIEILEQLKTQQLSKEQPNYFTPFSFIK